MANPTPIRPWLRLASIRSNPTQAQEPRTTSGLPPLRITSAPSSPPTHPPNAFSSSSLPTSPVHKPTVPTSPHTHVPVASPTHSPKTIKQSFPDVNRPTSPPPPPPPPPSPSNSRTVLPMPSPLMKNHDHTKLLSDSATRLITIAGENKGAYMELTKKQEGKYLHKKGNGEVESNTSTADANNNHESTTSSSFPITAYMNSNVQCVNNSLLYHTSCSHHDPGLRLSLSNQTKPFPIDHHT